MNADGVWLPSPEAMESSRVVRFARWLDQRGIVSLADPSDYQQLQDWSANHPEMFWRAVADFFGVDFCAPAEQTLVSRDMPGARWFPGATLNLATHLLRSGADDRDAVILVRDDGHRESITFRQLRAQVGCVTARLRELGVGPGDAVAAYLPTCIEGVVGFIATAAVGATWSQTALDYGPQAAADRLAQLEPTVLLAGSGYLFKGDVRDRRGEVQVLRDLLPTVRHTILVETGGLAVDSPAVGSSTWSDALSTVGDGSVETVPFDHPLWVLFTSGTTGRPKGIVHGHGGALLEQLVSPGFHLDLHTSDVFFWFTSPNWMMWNAQVCGLLHGATIVLYDGSPSHPSADALWQVVSDLGVTVFGTSPGYLQLSARAELEPARDLHLDQLRIIGVTGSVLPAASNAWVRDHVGERVQVGSMSGGTDIVGIFVASAPTTPVWDGEISAVALGVTLEVWDDEGRRVEAGVPGEMVITAPMPSMPLYFLGDEDGSAYRNAYFSTYPGVWRQGDSITQTERGSVVIHGRSDATLNRNGVRIGSAEIYQIVESLPQVEDSLVVGVEQPDGDYWMPLFVVASPGTATDSDLPRLVREHVSRRASARHVPDEVIVVPALPHTRTGKKLEVPVKRILQGADPDFVSSMGAVDDPDALSWLIRFARERAVKA